MKILIVTPWCDDICINNLKGMPLNAFLMEKLIENGHQVQIFCSSGKIEKQNPEALLKLNKIFLPKFFCPTPIIHFVNIFFYFYHNLIIYRILRNEIEKKHYDIILNIAHLGACAIKILTRSKKIPFVMLAYGIFNLKKPFLPTKLIPYFQYILGFLLKPDKIITINDGSGPKNWLEKTLKIPENKIAEITNPRPLWNITKSCSNKNIVIGYLSRFNYEKRTDLFIQIASQMLEKYNDVNFIIAGGGALENEIIKLQKSHPKRVLYKGWLPWIMMQEIYKEIDILVSTTRYANGGLPVIEAQNCGIPVVTFNAADTKRFVIDGETGFLTPKLNIAEFVDKISVLVENKELREKFGKSAKKFILNNFPDTTQWTDFIVTNLNKVYIK